MYRREWKGFHRFRFLLRTNRKIGSENETILVESKEGLKYIKVDGGVLDDIYSDTGFSKVQYCIEAACNDIILDPRAVITGKTRFDDFMNYR